MIIKIGIWGSNCVGKTHVCEIIKNNSKYRISVYNFFQDTGAARRQDNNLRKMQKRKVLRFLYKTILTKRFSIARRFFWIKPKYETFQIDSNDSEIFLCEEGLIKKMYEIFPFSIANQKNIKLFKDFVYISPELLSIEEDYMDGFIYAYSEWENIISNMNRRKFYTSKYDVDILLMRYRAHDLLYSFLIFLCQIKGLPVITIDSYEDAKEIAKKFDVFIENIKRERKVK